MKRFQECNWLVKLWRYRFYIPIPFKFVYHMLFTDMDGELTYKQFWGVLIGESQLDMNWYHTSEEVFNNIQNKINKHKSK